MEPSFEDREVRDRSSARGVAPEVLAHYERYAEETRLQLGSSRLEFERTKDILERVLPAAPASILDVGGAAGAYSLWLAERGYEVHLVDITPRLIEEARKRSAAATTPLASIAVGDARNLPQADRSCDALLLMGPLYHLQESADRATALREANRVLRAGGTIAVAGVSRYASTLDGMVRGFSLDPRFVKIRDRDLVDGCHINDTNEPMYFTTAFFHRPEDLRAEMEAAGFRDVSVYGIEGIGWMLSDFDARWADPRLKRDVLEVARALERETSIVGASAHLLGVAHRG